MRQRGATFWPLRSIRAHEKAAATDLLRLVPHRSGWTADLGCGMGAALPAVDPKRCIGLDRSLAVLLRTARAYRVCADAEAAPLADGGFALVLAIGLAEYIADPEPLLSEAARLLKNDGFLLFTISPPGCFTRFRRLTGLPVYIHRGELLLPLFRKHGLALTRQGRTVTQNLFLLQKKRTP